MDIRVFHGDRARNVFQKGRFACLRRRNDQPPLSLSDRAHQIDAPQRQLSAVPQLDARIGIARRHFVKISARNFSLYEFSVDGYDLFHGGRTALPVLPDVTMHIIAAAKAVSANDRPGNKNVFFAGLAVFRAQKAVTLRVHFEHAAVNIFKAAFSLRFSRIVEAQFDALVPFLRLGIVALAVRFLNALLYFLYHGVGHLRPLRRSALVRRFAFGRKTARKHPDDQPHQLTLFCGRGRAHAQFARNVTDFINAEPVYIFISRRIFFCNIIHVATPPAQRLSLYRHLNLYCQKP